MGAEKRRRFQPDPRTWLLLCLLGLAAILVIHSEIGCLCLFLACLLIHLLAGNGGKILSVSSAERYWCHFPLPSVWRESPPDP